MVHLLTIEMKRELRLWWSYRVDAIVDVLLYPIVFTLLIFMFQGIARESNTIYNKNDQAASVIGILIWFWCMRTMVGISGTVGNEAETGTLEAIVKSPISTLRIFWARAIAISVMRGVQALLMGIIFVMVLGLKFHISVGGIFVALLTLVGACGVGVAFAGIAFLYKQVCSLAGVIANMSLFISGALVPINSLEWTFTVLRLVFPITWGTDLLRKILVEGRHTTSLSSDLLGLTTQTICLVTVGIIVFNLGLKKARKAATLATY